MSRPNSHLREGSEVRITDRPRWGVCIVTDPRDPSLLRVYVPLLGREVLVGRNAVETACRPIPDF